VGIFLSINFRSEIRFEFFSLGVLGVLGALGALGALGGVVIAAGLSSADSVTLRETPSLTLFSLRLLCQGVVLDED